MSTSSILGDISPLLPARLVIAVISGKGGVVKSTTSLGLAAEYARRRFRVALVDYDPQGGATSAAGLTRPDEPLLSTGHSVHGFTLYPSGRALAIATVDQLLARLQVAERHAELTLIDLSPALTDAAHVAALLRASLVVVMARTDAAGLVNVAEAVRLCVDASRRFAIVPALWSRTRLAAHAESLLRTAYNEQVCQTVIPVDVRGAEAAATFRPVTLSAPRSRASRATQALATELLEIAGGVR